MLARHRDAGPGMRHAQVVASRARAAFSGSRRGRWEHRRIGGAPHGTLLFSASGFACGATHRSAAKRATGVGHEDHPFWVYAGLTLVLQSRYGAGLASSSPLRGTAARPSSWPLFIRVRGRGVPRTSGVGGSQKSVHSLIYKFQEYANQVIR